MLDLGLALRRMLSRALLASALTTFGIVAGCSNDDDPASASATAISLSPATTRLSGMIGGKPFTVKSAFFVKNVDGTLDLIFSDKESACDDAKEHKLHAGETLVQVYQLGQQIYGDAPAAIGAVVSGDLKYARVKDTCASGTPVDENEIDKRGRVEGSYSINLTMLSEASVEGNLDLRFDDGSALAGTFELSPCSSPPSEFSYCL